MEPIIGANVPFSGSEATLGQRFDPERFRLLTRTHASRSRLRWFRALLNPEYDESRGRVATDPDGGAKWLWEEQTADPDWRVLAQGISKMRRYYPEGVLESSDVVLTVMPDEFPLGDHDRFILTGKDDTAGVPNARTLTRSDDALVRGGDPRKAAAGSGTITASGVNVTGSGTAFLSQVEAGDVLFALGVGQVVAAVNSNTSLTLKAAPPSPWAAVAFSVGRDVLMSSPAVRLPLVRTASGPVTVGASLSPDGSRVRWTSAASPAVGTRYAVRYDYLPTYVVIGDLGTARGSADGVPLPLRVVGRLWNPQAEPR